MIITTYKPDGTKTRQPIGYGGQLCHKATEPYEKREIGTYKDPTPEALQEPAIQHETTETHQKAGL